MNYEVFTVKGESIYQGADWQKALEVAEQHVRSYPNQVVHYEYQPQFHGIRIYTESAQVFVEEQEYDVDCYGSNESLADGSEIIPFVQRG